MSDFGSQIIYKQLLQRHNHIRIPMIQRDYAQGRPIEVEVRDRFLAALDDALKRPADDPSLPLNLDFIYGSVEGKNGTRFLPLDGQQRLTTLFLIHWYFAWCDKRLKDFRDLFSLDDRSRFSYHVRQSSNEFFDQFVNYDPNCQPSDIEKLSDLIVNQPWYFRSWQRDPTIQSILVMLDAIHERFALDCGLFERILNEGNPAITFQLLDLENFGLSDDLYIKMNARGKPLTLFETFKARYEEHLKKLFADEFRHIKEKRFPIADFVALRMDTKWSDLFWAYRDTETNLYDNALMNIFRIVALVSRDPEADSYEKDIRALRSILRSPTYSEFISEGWLDVNFTRTLIILLEAWAGERGKFVTLLPDSRYFDELGIFKRIVKSPMDLSYSEIVQFIAYINFLKKYEGSINEKAFQEWTRLVFNLAVNSTYDGPEDLKRSVAALQKLDDKSGDILTYFAVSEKPTIGFSSQQVVEEKLKAELILANIKWRPLIDEAEAHGYLRGQIEFLLSFSGINIERAQNAARSWSDEVHKKLQANFLNYMKKAQSMFDARGLLDIGNHHWQRALLSIGDYLLQRGSNYSFLVNGATEQDSWKRFLRGTGYESTDQRNFLRALWDRLNDSQPLLEQLETIVHEAKDLEPWRMAFIQTPQAIEYCGNSEIRWKSQEEIYLLKKSQMNGTHAELFTYCFYCSSLLPLKDQGNLKPLVLLDYHSVIGSEFAPRIVLSLYFEEQRILFEVAFKNGNFIIYTDWASLEKAPRIQDVVKNSARFVISEGLALKQCSPMGIEKLVLELAKGLSGISENS